MRSEVHKRLRRRWFDLNAIAGEIALILERINLARGMGETTRAEGKNVTVGGAKEQGVEFGFDELARSAVAQ